MLRVVETISRKADGADLEVLLDSPVWKFLVDDAYVAKVFCCRSFC